MILQIKNINGKILRKSIPLDERTGRKYIYFIISKKEGFLSFKKEKRTFLTFFFYQKRWKKEGKIAPLFPYSKKQKMKEK